MSPQSMSSSASRNFPSTPYSGEKPKRGTEAAATANYIQNMEKLSKASIEYFNEVQTLENMESEYKILEGKLPLKRKHVAQLYEKQKRFARIVQITTPKKTSQYSLCASPAQSSPTVPTPFQVSNARQNLSAKFGQNSAATSVSVQIKPSAASASGTFSENKDATIVEFENDTEGDATILSATY